MMAKTEIILISIVCLHHTLHHKYWHVTNVFTKIEKMANALH